MNKNLRIEFEDDDLPPEEIEDKMQKEREGEEEKEENEEELQKEVEQKEEVELMLRVLKH